jgi:hypothetical protein
MKTTEYERIIELIQKALNENAGHRINEYTGTGILQVLAKQIGEMVETEDDLSSEG